MKNKGALAGVTHGDFEAFAPEEADKAIQSKFSIRKSYNAVMKQLEKLPKGSTVMIETPDVIAKRIKRLPYAILFRGPSLFTRIADKARERGLNVIPCSPLTDSSTRTEAYSLIMSAGLVKKVIKFEKTLQKIKRFRNNFTLKKVIREREQELEDTLQRAEDVLPGSSKLSSDEALRMSLVYAEIMTNNLIKNALRYKPSLIVAGDYHIRAARKWLREGGFVDKTPVIFRLTRIFHRRGSIKDILNKLEAKRRKILENHRLSLLKQNNLQ